MIRAILTNYRPQRSRAPKWDAVLDGQVLCSSPIAICESARRLLELGYDPDRLMTVRHENSPHDSIKPCKIGALARWTVVESASRGLQRVRWKPFSHPQKVVSS